MKKNIFFIAFLLITILSTNIYAQVGGTSITTAVPILTISPDSRSGAMGDVGVATTPDANSQHWNPAKYPFTDNDFGLTISYVPWLQKLISDMSIAYIAGYKKIGSRQSVGFSMRYFSLGDITYTSALGDPIGNYKPYEVFIDGSYSLLLSKNISGAVALRFISSSLVTPGLFVDGAGASHPGIAAAGDLSFYYRKPLELAGHPSLLAIGTNISNLGTKISYSDKSEADFIPANLKFGSAFKYEIDSYNSVQFALDFNKLLVPSNPVYDGEGFADENILLGKPTDVTTSVAIFKSFYDAPYGFKEELTEYMISTGLEYWYNDKFALRGGYFHEFENKGNRKYFTAGMGMKLNVFTLDFAYLVSVTQQNPLEGTMRFTLEFNFEGLKNESKVE